MTGRYDLSIEGMSTNGTYKTHSYCWRKNRSRMPIRVPKRFLKNVSKHCARVRRIQTANATRYMCQKIELDGRVENFCPTNAFKGKGMWYDWCLVEFQISSNSQWVQYAACISGFVQFAGEDTVHISITTSTNQVSMQKMDKKFIVEFELGNKNDHHLLIDTRCIAHPSFVFENSGGYMNQYFCALPKRRWGRYFVSRIV